MICEILPVVFQSAGAEGDCYLLQPLIQPLREGHSALLRQIDALINVYVLTELGSQFLLGITFEKKARKDGSSVLK